MTSPHLDDDAQAAARLTRVVYELLDAHGDTLRIATEPTDDLSWEIHLDHLRALQRVAREQLAIATAGRPLTSGLWSEAAPAARGGRRGRRA